MTKNLERALASMMVEARRQTDRSACAECDPGGEGMEVWGELVNEVDGAVATENAEKSEMVKDLRACFRGLDSGKGSIPFIITTLRSVIFRLGENP